MLESYNFLKKDKIIGILSYDTETKKFSFKKISKNKKDYPLPFFIHTPFNDDVEDDILYNYLEERVIDKNNMGINEVLDMLGLSEWNLYDILKYNNGKTNRDMFWIDFKHPLKN